MRTSSWGVMGLVLSAWDLLWRCNHASKVSYAAGYGILSVGFAVMVRTVSFCPKSAKAPRTLYNWTCRRLNILGADLIVDSFSTTR
jgi:hypothetical protein